MLGFRGTSRISSGCGLQSPWKGPKSKHSCNKEMFTSEHKLMNPTAVPPTWKIKAMSHEPVILGKLKKTEQKISETSTSMFYL